MYTVLTNQVSLVEEVVDTLNMDLYEFNIGVVYNTKSMVKTF